MNPTTQFPAARHVLRDPPYQAVFESAALGIAICRLDGLIVEANPALSRMLGYSQEDLSGKHAAALYAEPHDQIAEERSTNPSTNDPSVPAPSLQELVRGEHTSLEIEKRYRRQDGSELWGHLTLSLGRDERRQPAFLIAMLADATQRRQMEEQLRDAQKVEIIGRLAGGIAHDFNNLLTGILLFCDLLTAGLESSRRELPTFETRGLDKRGSENDESAIAPSPRQPTRNAKDYSRELEQHVEEVRRAGEQGAAMTRQLLAIARRQTSEPRPVPINETVASTENLLRRLLGEQVEFVVAPDHKLDGQAGLVLADPAQLRQLLMNLVLNARDAMPHGGKIIVRTRRAEFPPPMIVRHGRLAPRRTAQPAVALVVSDNGCGMNAETRARLFEPFFTTKKPGEGTGLGLATVQRIVSESRGIIRVKSKAGRGTRIELLFPAMQPSANLFPIARSSELMDSGEPDVSARLHAPDARRSIEKDAS